MASQRREIHPTARTLRQRTGAPLLVSFALLIAAASTTAWGGSSGRLRNPEPSAHLAQRASLASNVLAQPLGAVQDFTQDPSGHSSGPSRSGAAEKTQGQLDLEYHLRLARPTAHLVDIEIDAAKVREPALDFVLPAWAPGRYAIYNFAKNVQEFQAVDAQGRPLPCTQPDKQTWRVTTAKSGGMVRARYRVFADELTGSFSQLDSTHANINGADVYMYIAGHKPDPVRLAVEAPAGWQIISALSLATDRHNFEAPNYDRLIDSPMEASPECAIEQFTERGKTFRVVVHSYGSEGAGSLNLEPNSTAGFFPSVSTSSQAGSPDPKTRLPFFGSIPLADASAPGGGFRATSSGISSLVEGLKKIVKSEMTMMPDPDFEHYTFFFHFSPEIAMGDGMEHLNSTEIIIRGDLREASVSEALENAAHEFFHVWNVKRLRPAGLGPFDYTKENYTTSLWFAEGVTQYYGYLHLLRAGLWTPQEFLDRLAGEVRNLELDPGRTLMSAESSSFHAWFYDRAPQMQETNFANSTISYYNKGALLGMLLDLEIRDRTEGAQSLDDLLRLMYRNFYQAGSSAVASVDPASTYYLPGRGYEEHDILAALNALTQSDLTSFFDRYISGTDPLPYAQALARAGLELKISAPAGSPPTLNASTRQEERGVRVLTVFPGGEAERAGLSSGDLLIDVDQLSLATEDLNTRLKMYPPGAEVPFNVDRHSRRLRIPVKLSPPAADQYSIEELAQPSSKQIRIRQGWLGK